MNNCDKSQFVEFTNPSNSNSNLSETSEVYETSYDTMWGPVMKAFPKRYKKSDGLQAYWVGARRHESWDFQLLDSTRR